MPVAPGKPVPTEGPQETGGNPRAGAPVGATHPLTDGPTNVRLAQYDAEVKASFDRIVPVLKEIASHRYAPDFTERARRLARDTLGVELPDHLLDDAWVAGIDMRRLFGWCVFASYHRASDAFYANDPLGGRDDPAFQRFLLDCGFHLMDVTPCADGRLAHAISYVLRLPYGNVRRKSYAGSLFDIENTVEKWVETELQRFREGVPNTADAPTRYLKTVIYHFSSVDPSHQGCAAHGSDDEAAARAGWERLEGFRQAIENGFCCGASVDLLLIGMDTDTDAIRVHVPDAAGRCDLHRWLHARDLYDATAHMTQQQARAHLTEAVRAHAAGTDGAGRPAPGPARRGLGRKGPATVPAGGPAEGMVALIARLIENNISQIDLVRQMHAGRYQDTGHAERFIGAGIGFEEIQLRNLTYFAYLNTVEEGAADLDVGIRIFSGLNVSHGLPVPVVVRHDYHGSVPGARQRAVGHVDRIAAALLARYPQLVAQGLLHVLRVVRDCDAAHPIEIVGSTLEPAAAEH
ncbi:carboxysome shell carbonic anhydrase [Thiohalocapsa marina]|uniref:Carboxysome shell carbonic anhydrase n=1 Tax=Thiohalocapsa marina TaxID=424902 RepID=A0A5M8FUK1_9GAMM|nr:carboxysome shell carbonic anhydrase [Thiohalocapsa marina]KAA6187465.1 carboxysome shell carbonic anhydrase [Thiohalocapsa marina]